MELRYTAQHDAPLLRILRTSLRLSSTLVKRLKTEHAFYVSGSPAHTDQPVRRGETVTVVLREPPPSYPTEDGPLTVLYEDEGLLAVDKPPGLWVHPTPSRQTGTLANYAAFHLRGQPCGVHIITRLDRDTFGVVLLAKYAHLHSLAGRALAAGLLQKTYLATVFGTPPQEAGTIELPIAQRPNGSLLREVRPDGQAARTDYRLLERRDGLSLLELRPKTGRTHQLRVHCAALGCPILGDQAYGTAASLARAGALGVLTQQLCAASLSLPHPLTGDRLEIAAKQMPFFPI